MLLTTILRRQHGLITRRQALASGLSSPQIVTLLRAGHWEHAARGVYRVAGSPVDYPQRVLSACLAVGPEAVASHGTAATLLSLGSGVIRREPIHVTTARTASRRGAPMPGVLVHRSSPVLASDRAVVDGIPVTRPARTLVELAGDLSRTALAEVVDDAFFRQRGLTARGVLRVLERLRPRSGGPALRETLQPWMSGPRPGSQAEMRLLRLLVAGGLPAPERQYDILDDHGRFVARADLAYPDAKVAIEYLGERHHGPRTADHDERRRNRVIDAGWLPSTRRPRTPTAPRRDSSRWCDASSN